MSLLMKQAKFQNFRCLKDAVVVLEQHSVIIGANNSGKTAIMEGLALALNRDRLIRNVDDYDFRDGFYKVQDPVAKHFLIKVLITGFEPNDPAKHPEWFCTEAAGVGIWWVEPKKRKLAA